MRFVQLPAFAVGPIFVNEGLSSFNGDVKDSLAGEQGVDKEIGRVANFLPQRGVISTSVDP